MIEPSSIVFPNNIVVTLKNYFKLVYAPIDVFARPIRKGDPIQAIGITAALWSPQEDSAEFLGVQGRTGATVQQYLIGIQTFVQDMDEERGLQTSATLAGSVRARLSRDIDLRVALALLTSNEFGYTERFTKSTVQGQRFLSNEIEGSFYYLANLELLVETEIN